MAKLEKTFTGDFDTLLHKQYISIQGGFFRQQKVRWSS